MNFVGYKCGVCGQVLIKLGKVNKDEKVVLIVSGFGFKDPGDADKLIDKPVTVDIKDLESVIAKG